VYALKGIIGLKVSAIKGYRSDLRTSIKNVIPEYILFDDRKTYIKFEDQDYYTYHDCDGWAKCIEVEINEEKWHEIMIDDERYPHATKDLSH